MKLRKILCSLMVLVLILSVLPFSTVTAGALTSGDFVFDMYDDNSVVITGYNRSKAEKLTIPSTLGGYPVKAIGESAFEGCEIYSVTLPDTLEVVGDFAFFDTGISTVKIPKNLYYLGIGAFTTSWFESYTVDSKSTKFSASDGVLFSKDMKTLVSFPTAKETNSYTIPSTVETIGTYAFYSNFFISKITIPSSVKNIDPGAFFYSAITSVTIPASCEYIGVYAFASCTELSSVKISGNNTFVAPYAFDECKWYTLQNAGMIYFGNIAYLYKGVAPEEFSLKEGTVRLNGKALAEQKKVTKINIPASVKEIDLSAFDQCSALTEISVAPDNTEYTTIDGMLYTKDRSTLLVCPAGKSGVLTLPESTAIVTEYAFEYCEKLTEVTLPFGVTEIGEGAFTECSSLKKVTIPESVTTAGEAMFFGCDNLEEVVAPDGFAHFYIYDFFETSWLEKQPSDKIIYLNKSALGYNGDPTGIDSFEIEEGALSIGEFAFFGHTDLVSITLPESLKTLGHYAFTGCTSLKEITLPASLDEFGAYSLGFDYSYDLETGEETFTPIEGFVIKGYTNSGAEAYAAANGFEFVSIGEIEFSKLLGDVDGDGVITVRDATTIQKNVAGMVYFGAQEKVNADFNLDGNVNVRDATAIQKHIAGLPY